MFYLFLLCDRLMFFISVYDDGLYIRKINDRGKKTVIIGYVIRNFYFYLFVIMQNTCIMPTLQIRDLPQTLFDALQTSAETNRRSLTQEAIVLLEKAIENEERKARKMDAIKRMKELSSHFKGVSIDDVVSMIREDRDR